MITTLFILFLVFFFVALIVCIPFAAIKLAKTKKIQCPKCENHVKIMSSPGKCPMCKVKLYKHGDGTFKVLEKDSRK